MQSRAIWLLISFAALVACEPPTSITGSARVVDGDSLEINDISVRIHGTDAPEGRQTCLRDGVAWPCGEAAANKMRQLVQGRTISCVETDIDTYGRTVARCNNGVADLGAEMVLAGLALAYRQYGKDYVDEEARAEAARVGMWAGEFTAPWEWRRNPVNPVVQAESSPAPDTIPGARECLIKGNINRRGDHIYHVPGSPNYEQTRIDESRGERWFCTEREALDAGWRAPRG